MKTGNVWQRYIIKIQIQFRNKSKENLLKINHLTIKIIIKDYQEIKDVIMLYTNGCATGDVELTKKSISQRCYHVRLPKWRIICR